MRHKTVLNGHDYEAIDILMEIHCGLENPLILDCTHNSGKMWKKSSFKPIRSDINPEFPVDLVADFMHMPFLDKTFDVVVFDPPHLPTNVGSSGIMSNIWGKTYGITTDDKYREGDNVSPMFDPFLIEAKRVLKTEGIILAKIADLINNHRYQWQHVDFINACRVNNMIPCDMMIKCDPSAGNLMSSKWKNVKHLRKAHSYWLVVRVNGRCEKK
jgi:SAM-dependent methyltransferase